MKTSPVTHQDLRRSVIAVPGAPRGPVAERARTGRCWRIWRPAARSVMYGGNANFYNVGLGEYARIVDMLAALAVPTPGSCRRRGRTTAR